MDEDQFLSGLPALLNTHWHQEVDSADHLGGGMNSITALVTTGGQRWVAKWVAGSGRAAFQNGADVAARLAATGMRSGRPLPTVEGEFLLAVDGGYLAVLEFVLGRELTDHVTDQAKLAGALARAHTVLGTSRHRGDFFGWILPAIDSVVAEYRSLPPLTWGTLHADPATEAFLLDEPTGEVGIIDWAGACNGPLLYDVASAVMYLGGARRAATFLSHYADTGPVPRDELHDRLTTFRRFRAIVQADYFGRRILTNDLTGIDSPTENQRGLNDARRMLEKLGVL